MASSSKTQIKPCSNLSGKVRVVARVRGFSDQELASDATHSSSIISVHKSGDIGTSEKVKLSFDDQTSSHKNEYEVDCCYLQNGDTTLIFSKEIKPHISRVFDGETSTFIAFGARGSGKTYTIQGSEENLGLGMLAMDEILKIAEVGKHTVAISIYEVFQNHVYDLLDSKNSEVQVLEGAQGKIILKGLSKVPVKSMLEFQKLYCSGSNSNKSTQKITLELPRRSHKALMIHILASDEETNPKCVGKMNFIDLAGYENLRRNSIGATNIVEGTQINKSLSALLNVIQAINANDSRVPYRENKLSRVLQESLGGNNHISLLVCMNPLFCPDTIHVATLASRLKNIKPVDVSFSAKKHSNSICSTTKKQINSRLPLSAKKTNVMLKGRDLFGGTEANGIKELVLNTANKVNSSVTTKKQTHSRFPLSAKKTNVLQKGRGLFGGTEQENGIKEQGSSMVNNPSNITTSDIPDGDSIVVPYVKEEYCTSDGALFSSDAILACSPKEKIIESGEIIPHVNDENIEKENNGLLFNEGPSPPPSVGLKNILDRLQSLEMKNNLKPLDSSTPSSMSRLQDANTEVSNFVDNMEPKTPIVTTHKMDISNCQSGTFSKRSSGMKQSLVQDYLQFLNSASKDELKGIRGIGEKRATYILELREESPEPFKSLDDLQEIGLSAKQVKSMMKNVAGCLFG